MCQHAADEDAARRIVDLCDQPVLIALDVEHRPLANGVRGRKRLTKFGKTPPRRLLRNAEPSVERTFELSVPRNGLFELLAADDVHNPPQVRILRTFYSQNANMSRFTCASLKRVDPRHALADDQRVYVVRAFVSLHRLQVHHVAHYRIVVGHAVRAQNVAREASAFESHPDIVSL